MPPHRHVFHELIAVLDGSMRLHMDGVDLCAETGDLLFYPAEQTHEEVSDTRLPVNTFFVAFTTPAGFPCPPVRTHDLNGRVRQMLGWLVDDVRSGVQPEQRSGLMQAILEELRKLCGAPTDPWLADLRRFMEQHLAEAISLDNLAEHAGMSKFSLIRRYKRLCGSTPMQDLQRTRLNRACTLIQNTDLPLKAIAPAVGIGDAYQLSRLFRRQFRVSPSQLRRR